MVGGAGWPPIRGEIGGSCTTHLKATADHVDSRCVLVSVHDGITHWTVQYFGRLPLAYEVGPYDEEQTGLPHPNGHRPGVLHRRTTQQAV